MLECVGTWTDISDEVSLNNEREMLNWQIQKADKFESLSRMAGGIAHDFNNLLMAIQGNAEVARHIQSGQAQGREQIDRILESTQRATRLTEQILAFSGHAASLNRPLRLDHLLVACGQTLRDRLPPAIQLDLDPGNEALRVRGDEKQLQQLLANLVENAREAIGEDPGLIQVRLAQEDLEGDPTLEDALETGLVGEDNLRGRAAVRLSVRDNGCGMEQQVLDRIFEPFYTTNFTGRGLGLAAVYGIIQGHGGALRVRSRPGAGSLFEVYLPLESEEQKPVDIPEPKPHGRDAKHPTILLVDDEAPVREVTRQMLEMLQYNTLIAPSGQRALDLFRANREIQCVLLDMMMPGMDGKEVFERMRSIRQDCRVVICSGYSREDLESSFRESAPAGYLQKPYSLEQLSSTLAEILLAADGDT